MQNLLFIILWMNFKPKNQHCFLYIYDMKIPYFVLVSLQIKLENKTYCLSFCEWISNQNQHCFLYIYDMKIPYFVLVSLQIKLENKTYC